MIGSCERRVGVVVDDVLQTDEPVVMLSLHTRLHSSVNPGAPTLRVVDSADSNHGR